ncbi:hypothetical protein GGS20DRAFT_56423 [Poronia punctata]|nr:hypothetical protein GGS20DRAFT_56423 [Poronia punctata]
MDIPSRYPRGGAGAEAPPPAIRIEDQSGRFSHSRAQGLGFAPSSIPVSIPNLRRTADDDAPPPLPPPRYVPSMGLPGPPNHDRFPSIDSNASWDSGGGRDSGCDPDLFKKHDIDRTVGRPHHRDEGYSSLNSTGASMGHSAQDSLPRKLFMSHNQYQFKGGNDYDNSLLKKLDPRRNFGDRSPPRRSGLSMSITDERDGPEPQRHPRIAPVDLPIRSNNQSLAGSASRFAVPPLQTTLSPGGSFWKPSAPGYRSPIEPMDMERSPLFRSRRNNSDDATMSTHSYDNTEDTDFPMEETSGMRKLYLDDPHPRVDGRPIGHKRRASSSPGGDSPPQAALGASEVTRRRDGASRGSPVPRLSLVPPSALSAGLSSSSAGTRHGSFVSTMSLNTSISSHTSLGGRSPSGLSSGGMSPVDVINTNSPYNTPISIGHSPCTPFSRGLHQRNLSNENRLTSPRKVGEVPKATISKAKAGYYMCNCCPKKPKKFETAEELSNHTAEKQYECNYCGNRFKNKNEAERHQNSLHVRRHSWSCSALLMAGCHRAFHESTISPGEADTCGYCGEEFPRSKGPAGSRKMTESEWQDRLRHLQEVHKFRECNSSKKFYRADHFRQHLKHSHAGTSGKWTNMLEAACMLNEEEPPPPQSSR